MLDFHTSKHALVHAADFPLDPLSDQYNWHWEGTFSRLAMTLEGFCFPLQYAVWFVHMNPFRYLLCKCLYARDGEAMALQMLDSNLLAPLNVANDQG